MTYLFGLEKLGIKFGLANIRAICEALGHPEAAWPSVIVAGTNGKGSVSAMTDAALVAAGLRTGRYTSPHLVRLEERIAVSGTPVSPGALSDAAALLQRTVAALRAEGRLETEPTFFEVTTAMAFELFRRAEVEVGVLEVGMGGRFDATAVAPSMAAAITTIDLDHERFLGRTIGEIAFEKAGVIRPGMPVVVGETKPEAVAVIRRAADERGARFVAAGEGVRVEARVEDGLTRLALETPRARYGPFRLGLRGRHQVANAVVAVRLLEELREQGLPVHTAAIERGLAEVSWPGRLDLVPAGGGKQLLLDAAHNPAGASVLAAYLAEAYPQRLPLVFCAMSDKDVAGMLEALAPRIDRFIATTVPMARALPADALAAMASMHVRVPVVTEPDSRHAIGLALDRAPVACVAGSIFLVGEVLGRLRRPDSTAPAR